MLQTVMVRETDNTGRDDGLSIRPPEEFEPFVQTLLDAVSDAVTLMRISDGQIVDCNRAWLNLFQADRDDIVGKYPWDLSPDSQANGWRSDELAQNYLRAARSGELSDFDWVHLNSLGERIYVEVALTRIEFGGEAYFLACLHDMTTVRQAGERLERSAEFQRRKADLMMVLTTMTAEDLDTSINTALEQFGRVYELERIGLWQYYSYDKTYTRTHHWRADESVPDTVPERVEPADVGALFERLREDRPIVVQDIGKMPAGLEPLGKFLDQV